MSDWYESRRIVQRILIKGQLVLLSPTHLGNGERGEQVDLPLLRDPLEERPLLMGTSIAGALRSYLQERQYGYFEPEKGPKPEDNFQTGEQKRAESDRRKRENDAARLFGGAKGDEYGDQSPLIIEDAFADITPAEIRDGVRIDGAVRTAQDKFKFDLELLPTGTSFDLCFELLIGERDDAAALKAALALALRGLETGAISIGARTSRGFGRCEVSEWRITTYNLRESRADLLAWLAADHASWDYALAPEATKIGHAANVLAALPKDHRKRNAFSISAIFALASPLLIRSEEPLNDGNNQPEFAHIRDSNGIPIIPGTSLAGALRARAFRILNTIKPDIAQAMIDSLFGKDMQNDPSKPTASRLVVEEVPVTQQGWLVQNRVAIDRFTGGALDTALFSEAPLVGGQVVLTMTIRKPKDAEKGLLLLLLKDLWTSDLPIGGTSSIGRGRLRGISATITGQIDGEAQAWQIGEVEQKLHINAETRALFERYVTVLNQLEVGSYA